MNPTDHEQLTYSGSSPNILVSWVECIEFILFYTVAIFIFTFLIMFSILFIYVKLCELTELYLFVF